jgi:prevent-host-death family protein
VKSPSVVNVHEAKTQLSKLLARVEGGEEITIAKAGQPFARLVPLAPVAPLGPRVPGRFQGMLGPLPDSLFFDPMPDDELARWEGRLTHPGDPLTVRP